MCKEDEEEDVRKYWMTLRTGEDTLIWKRRLWIALCGGIVLEEALDLSSDSILNNNNIYINDWFKPIFPFFLTRLLHEVPNTYDRFCPSPCVLLATLRLCMHTYLHTYIYRLHTHIHIYIYTHIYIHTWMRTYVINIYERSNAHGLP